MSALVPFASGAAARNAARFASYAYANRAAISRASTAVGAVYRGYRARQQTKYMNARKRARMSTPYSYVTPMRNANAPNRNVVGSTLDNNDESWADAPPQTWTDIYVTQLSGGYLPVVPAVPYEGGRGTKSSIFVNHFDICRTFYYRNATESGGNAGPVKLRYFVVQMKDDTGKQRDIATDLAYIRTSFFRDNSSTSGRTKAFVNAGNTALSWSDYPNCLDVNPDAAFKVLYQTSMILQTNTADTTAQGVFAALRTVKKRIKINKNLDFVNDLDTLYSHPIIEIWFYQSLRPEQYPTAIPNGTAYCRTYATNRASFRPTLSSKLY